MNYDEYLKCARKHIRSCKQMLKGLKNGKDEENKEAYLDVWYLSGYILEGLTVYCAYKTNNWNPRSSSRDGITDIQTRYDKTFSKRTHLDFYRRRTINKYNVFPEGMIVYSVQGHDFQSIIMGVLRANPTFRDFPILGNGNVDEDVKILVQEWKPNVRYWHKEEEMADIPHLNSDVLSRLIGTCEALYKDMIRV